MALPKSIRYLAGATLCVFAYLFVQILKGSGSEIELQFPNKLPSAPGRKNFADWDHDPQLDRRETILCYKIDLVH